MFGACTGALFRYLLGICVENTGIVIAPAAFSVPLAVKGQLLTRFGEISVERRSDDAGGHRLCHSFGFGCGVSVSGRGA